jgi:hypothetical protein
MFCPRCGQEQISNETRFCSRCGFLMTGVVDLVAGGGNSSAALKAPSAAKIETPRRRGIKKGFFIFLLTFLVVPIVSILTVMANAEPFGVAISAIVLFVGGILRMIYALMFESNEPTGAQTDHSVYETAQSILSGNQNPNALPPQQSVPTSAYMPPTHGSWRDTNDLEPSSVTDPTTKLLQKDQ